MIVRQIKKVLSHSEIDCFKKAPFFPGEAKNIYQPRGGKQLEKEGSGYERTVIIQFNSFNEASACYTSKEYQKALEFVKSSAHRLVAITEGID